MGVIYGFAAPWAAADGPGSGPGDRRLDYETATLFLRAQASWLRRGLERCEDPAAVGIILGSHDASHESWLALIAMVEEVNEDLADSLATLYSYHGRIVGTLERGFDRRLDPRVCRDLQRMLGTHLSEMTDAVVAELSAMGDGDVARSGDTAAAAKV